MTTCTQRPDQPKRMNILPAPTRSSTQLVNMCCDAVSCAGTHACAPCGTCPDLSSTRTHAPSTSPCPTHSVTILHLLPLHPIPSAMAQPLRLATTGSVAQLVP
ncbi:hypothetical protein C8Q74DRAFT_230151 [Fomes fomentarius]|nr:hypothetical protein C8Q74DRAFT_230151 [Fomes fomentarius]